MSAVYFMMGVANSNSHFVYQKFMKTLNGVFRRSLKENRSNWGGGGGGGGSHLKTLSTLFQFNYDLLKPSKVMGAGSQYRTKFRKRRYRYGHIL